SLLAELRSQWLQAPRSRSASPGQSVSVAEGVDADQAVAVALTYNPELRALRWEHGIAQGEVAAASAISNPSVQVFMKHLQDSGAGGEGWSVELRWTPPRPVEWSANRARAD